MATSSTGNKLPNINGLQDAKPRHSLGYRVQHHVRTAVAAAIAATLVFVGTANLPATWMDVNGIIKNNSVDVIGQGSLNTDASIIDPNSGKPIEFVLIGQDSRDGAENQAIGGSFDDVIGNHQADTAMIVQIRRPQGNQPGLHSTRFPGGRASVRNVEGHDSRTV